MQCPKCFEFVSRDVPSNTKATCPSCGFDISLFVSMEKIRQEIQLVDTDLQDSLNEAGKNLARTKTSVAKHLGHLREKLDSLETQIALGPQNKLPENVESLPHETLPGEETRQSKIPVPQVPAEFPEADGLPQGRLLPPMIAGQKDQATENVTRPISEVPTGGVVVSAKDDRHIPDFLSGSPRPPKPPKPSSTNSDETIDFGFSEIGVGQKWMLIVGVLFIVLGIAFFLKYAFDNNWISPTGQVILAYLAGMSLIGVGEGFRRKELQNFGLYLIGSGIATFYVTTYSAFQIYRPKVIEEPVIAFGIMVLVTILDCTLAVIYDTKWLAVLGLIGGFLTPVLVSTGQDQQVALMTYMALLNFGILSVGLFKRWKLLNYLGFVSTWLLFSGWFMGFYSADRNFWVTTFFLNLFFLIYSVLPFADYFVQTKRSEKVEFDVANFALTIPNTLWAFGFSYHMISGYFSVEYVSVVSLAYSFLFSAMAHFIYKKNQANLDPFVLLLSMGMLSLIITVPLLFKGHLITIFWAAQTFALMWAALRLRNESLYGGALLLLLVTVGHFVFFDWSDFWLVRGVLFSVNPLVRWMTTITVLGVMFQMARMMNQNTWPSAEWGNYLYGLFTILLLITMTFEDRLFFDEFAPRFAPAALSVFWSLFSVGMIGIGFVKRLSVVRKCAIGLFVLTIVKVFLFDMAEASTPSRIISFIVLGLMLVGASFLYHRYKTELLAAIDEKEC